MQADTITEPPSTPPTTDSYKTNGISTIKSQALTNGHSHAYNPRDYLSDRAKVTQIDGIRGLFTCEGPGIVSFVRASYFGSAGRPNPTTFPFSSITLNLKSPLGSHAEASSAPESITIEGEDLDAALQYGPSAGLPKLRAWLENLQSIVHKREKNDDFTITLGSGSQDLMYKGFMSVLNSGDPVLLETPIYAGVLPPLRHLHADMIEVEVDDKGLSADNLEKVLSQWPNDKKRPKVLYTSPVGANPSGSSSPKERKLAVLEVCKKYNILIFEDDPYYYLAQKLIPSYFELETQVYPEGGHVVRFDSFSKLLSAGLRLGFATGPKEILHAIDVNTSAANLHTSAVSQGVALRLIQHWGIDGFLAHGHAVADLYAERRAQMEALAHKHLDGLATWVSPVAGMFLWIDMTPAGIDDSFQLIRHEALAKGVLGVPGMAFYPSGRKSPHVRLSFSVVDLEGDADLGLSRLAETIREKQKSLGLIKG